MMKSSADRKADAIRVFKKSARPEPGAFDKLGDYDVSVGAHKIVAALRPVASRLLGFPSNVVAGFSRRFG